VKRHGNQPFFLYWSINMPHANNEAKDLEVPDHSAFADRDWPTPQKKFAAMMTKLDSDVGRMMETLKEQGLDERTLVIFTSDNGPHREGGNDPQFHQSSGPLRGIKRDLYEGGIRVPFIARWPKQITPGSQSDLPIAFWDFMPTACEVAGRTVPPELKIDGLSFLPTLLNKGEQKKHASLYWEFYEGGFSQAARVDNWKGVKLGAQKTLELYDLSVDIGEKNNLAAQHPDIVARLETVMRESHVPSPFWPLKPANAPAATAKK
jgi:arylsulfatase A-like enzyme